ncbi:type ISP restriction/modification enzyme [Stenomitos frigidus]|nr:type ISP restriction/modification enzyme [Stenomitos frigidus]
MQSLLEVHSKEKARESFRRPQQTDTIPFNRVNHKARTAPQKVYSRLNRKVDALSKRLRAPLERSQTTSTSLSVQFPIAGSNRVEAVRYIEPRHDQEGQIWINQTQYFEGVSHALWDFSLGGRQVCQKWLQERQDCTLCEQSIQHYQRMVTILKDVVELMASSDRALHGQSRNSLTSAVSY